MKAPSVPSEKGRSNEEAVTKRRGDKAKEATHPGGFVWVWKGERLPPHAAYQITPREGGGKRRGIKAISSFHRRGFFLLWELASLWLYDSPPHHHRWLGCIFPQGEIYEREGRAMFGVERGEGGGEGEGRGI